MSSQPLATSVMTDIQALNSYVTDYHKGSQKRPRSWDDTLLFRKYQFPGSLDLSQRLHAAVSKFATNRHRLQMELVPFENIIDFDFADNHTDQAKLLRLMRNICHDAFRDQSKETMHKNVNRSLDFPKGAGYATRRDDARNKRYTSGTTVTHSALRYAYRNLKTDVFSPNVTHRQGGAAESRNISFVDGNRFISVPKNTETERLICIEPEVNSYYQKGIGAWLKTVVKDKFGIDLSCQIRNRTQCADFRFSTIDLASASDSVTCALVKFILPRRVYTMLNAFRSTQSKLFDVNLSNKETFNTFSTMGNGYTFELESLIFACITRACTQFCGTNPDEVSVFGDDIIVRNEAVDTTISLLNLCGFSVNTDKSFTKDDTKRESCGFFYEEAKTTDTLMNVTEAEKRSCVLVSPLALKGPFVEDLYITVDRKNGSYCSVPLDPELIRCHNEMLRYATTTNMAYRNDKLYRFYRSCISKIRALFPIQMLGRGHYGENSYLLADTLRPPTQEIALKVRRSTSWVWTNRLLGRGLYGPSAMGKDDYLFVQMIKDSNHRSQCAFGHTADYVTEQSSHEYIGFHLDEKQNSTHWDSVPLPLTVL